MRMKTSGAVKLIKFLIQKLKVVNTQIIEKNIILEDRTFNLNFPNKIFQFDANHLLFIQKQ